MRLVLKVILFVLGAVLRRRSNRPLVKVRLRDRNHTVQICTADGRVGRYYVFCDGEVFSRSGVLAKPDASLVWKNAAVAVRALRSSDPDALPAALASESLQIVGNGEVATWFGDVTRAATGRIPEADAAMPIVAVVGLGRMGSGIANSLLRAGFPVVVHNRTAEKARRLVAAGATLAATPAAAARSAKYVITSLMGDTSIFAVVEGPDGILAGLERDAVHIGASTISADATGAWPDCMPSTAASTWLRRWSVGRTRPLLASSRRWCTASGRCSTRAARCSRAKRDRPSTLARTGRSRARRNWR